MDEDTVFARLVAEGLLSVEVDAEGTRHYTQTARGHHRALEILRRMQDDEQMISRVIDAEDEL